MMTLITATFLIRCGASPEGAGLYAASLDAACQKRGIITTSRIEAFLSEVLNESAAMTRVLEDCDYRSAAYLREVYPSKFPTIASAAPFVGNSSALAAKVYGTFGGTDLRGRGLAQLTGLGNYQAYGKAVGKSVPEVAAYLVTPEGAADSAAWFFMERGCASPADRGDLQEVTRLWEGSLIGWPSVQTWHAQVLRAMDGSPAVAVHAGTPAGKPPVTKPVAQAPAQISEADRLDDEFNPPEGASA